MSWNQLCDSPIFCTPLSKFPHRSSGIVHSEAHTSLRWFLRGTDPDPQPSGTLCSLVSCDSCFKNTQTSKRWIVEHTILEYFCFKDNRKNDTAIWEWSDSVKKHTARRAVTGCLIFLKRICIHALIKFHKLPHSKL